MGKKYTTHTISIGDHNLDAPVMVQINALIADGLHSEAGYLTEESGTTKLTDAEIAEMGYIKTYTDTDTNTQLSDAQIAEMGYIKTYTDTNTNTQLTSAQIAAMGYLSTATGLEVFRSEKNTDDQGTYMFAQDDGGWTGGARLAGAHNGYGVISMHLHTGSYYGQIHLSSLTSDMGIRFQENSTTWGSIYTVHTSKHFSTVDVANGKIAHGWGNHADAGYLTSYTDTNTTYGNTDFVDLTSAQTVGGIKTFTSDMVIKNGDPTLGFADTTANADDFYIHVNSNNFYVLADRDDSGLNNGISGWDGSHPLQLESDTNKAYTFGNEIYHTGNIPTWNQSTTGTANNATNLGGINASEYAHGTEGSFTVGGSRSNFYPVKLSKGRMRGVFTIYRENVHENGSSFGSGRLIIRATTSGWGHTPLKFSYEAIVQSQHLFGFLASNYRTGYMMVMLRGGTTYHYIGSDTFKLSDGNASGVSLSDGRTTYNATALALVDVNYSGEAPSYKHIPYTNHEYGDTAKKFSGSVTAPNFIGSLTGNATTATTATTAANSLLLNGLTYSASGGSNKILASHATNGYLYINNWIHPANGTGMFYDAGVHFYETGNYMYSNTGLQAANDMRAPLFYDRNDTSYYLNPASTSNLNVVQAAQFQGSLAGTASNANTLDGFSSESFLRSDADNAVNAGVTYTWARTDTAGLIFTNNSYNTKLYMGGWTTANSSNISRIRTSSGNLHIDSASNGNTYLNWYSGGDVKTNRLLQSEASLRAPIFYDSNSTSYYMDPSNSNVAANFSGGIQMTGNYGVGITGKYTSTRLQTIFNMGTSYKLPNDGNSTGSAYGLYWSHQNAGATGGANNLASHGLIILEAGNYKGSWGGGRIVTTESVRAPLFYDSNNTGYYTNPAGTSVVQRITHVNHSTPILIKVNSAYKSWVHHVSSSSSYIFAPSTANGGESWDWANQMSISTSGVVTANNFVLSSDKRSKTKIKDLTCDNIDVSWKSFEMKGNEGDYRTGVIAQELEETNPEFVNTDEKGFKSVKYIDLLIAKIAELEARLEKLEK